MKNKLPIIVPIVIIVALVGIIAYQFAKSQFGSSSSSDNSSNRVTPPAGAGGGVGGPPDGTEPSGGKITPPSQ